jgi:hypothetical protein
LSTPRATTVLSAESRISLSRFEVRDERRDDVCGCGCAVSRRCLRIRHQIKSQAPNPKLQRTPNHQSPNQAPNQSPNQDPNPTPKDAIGSWELVLEVVLEFWDLEVRRDLGFGAWDLTLVQTARLRLRSTASASIPVPHADSASACGHRSSSPMPFRKIPRTMTRK